VVKIATFAKPENVIGKVAFDEFWFLRGIGRGAASGFTEGVRGEGIRILVGNPRPTDFRDALTKTGTATRIERGIERDED